MDICRRRISCIKRKLFNKLKLRYKTRKIALATNCMKSIVVISSSKHKKSKSFDLDFFMLCRKAQHHLIKGQHHFEKRENIISNLFGTNERCCAVGANDVLRENGFPPSSLEKHRKLCYNNPRKAVEI